MTWLHEWFLRRRDHLAFFSAVFASMLMLLSNDNRHMQALQAWTLDGLGVVLDRLATVKQWQRLAEENRALRRMNAELLLQVSRLYEAKLENARLRNMLAFKQESAFGLIPAKVVGREANGFEEALLLGAGRRDGVRRNQAVVTAEGLVGKIHSVGARHAVTQVLLDRNFRVSALIRRSRVRGIVRWQEGRDVILAEIPKRSDVQPGDVVVTSGVSTVYPPGVTIGKVRRVTEGEGMFMDVRIEPAVDFSKLEEVFVVRDQPTPSS